MSLSNMTNDRYVCAIKSALEEVKGLNKATHHSKPSWRDSALRRPKTRPTQILSLCSPLYLLVWAVLIVSVHKNCPLLYPLLLVRRRFPLNLRCHRISMAIALLAKHF